MATITMHNGKRNSGKGKYQGYKTYASMQRVIRYITNPEKTRPDLIRGYNCSPQNAYQEFKLNKLLWNKGENGQRRMLIHFSQNFSPEDEVSPEMASEIAEKLLKHPMFQGYQTVYATHLDSGKLHTHFVIDSVNRDTGKMWQLTNKDLDVLKRYSDSLCQEYHLSVCQKDQSHGRPYTKKDELVVRQKTESWKEEIRLSVSICKESAVSRDDFIHKLKQLGIHVTWTDQRKYITFSDRHGHKVRNHRLEPMNEYTKEALEKQFLINNQYEELLKQKAMEENKEMNVSLPYIHSLLYIAKNVVRMAEQPYPLQRSPEFGRLKSKTSKEAYMAEQQKGKGIERE